MYSGKTTELMRQMDRHDRAGQTTITYKYKKDVRFGEDRAQMVSSHNGVNRPGIPIDSLKSVPIIPNTIYGIDEGQFIDGLEEFAESAANQGCTVIISALNSDFRRNPFPIIQNLISKVEKIKILHAVCYKCKKDASFTKRIVDGDQVEMIGAEDMYKAVCRTCFQVTH
jgi:thymidine kinase